MTTSLQLFETEHYKYYLDSHLQDGVTEYYVTNHTETIKPLEVLDLIAESDNVYRDINQNDLIRILYHIIEGNRNNISNIINNM